MSTLAAARADNFYYPKDWDPTKGSLNKFHKSHPLGNRASKIDEGIITVRFEVPFNIRCKKCENMIAKGVRFNSKKKKVGKYLSTIIYDFYMNCHRCGNKMTIRTDPKGCDYLLINGCEKKMEDWIDAATQDPAAIQHDTNKTQKLGNDAFYRLENEREDVIKGTKETPRINNIIELNKSLKQDYDLNSKMRDQFREKKTLDLEIKKKNKEKYMLDIPLIEDHDNSDMILAKRKKFMGPKKCDISSFLKREKIRNESIFGNRTKEQKCRFNLLMKKAEILPLNAKKLLKQEVKKNTTYKKLLGRICPLPK